jgi:hypothetical protein
LKKEEKKKGVAAPRLAISNYEKEWMAHAARPLPVEWW